jgi:hypothetical protein
VYESVKASVIDPRDFGCPMLAADLADHWVRISPEIPGVSQEVRGSIVWFCRALSRLPGADELTLPTLRRSHLDRYEQRLIEEQATKRTDTPYRRMVFLLTLLRRIDHDEPGMLHPEVAQRIGMTTRLHHVRSDGEVPFSTWERRQLIAVAMRRVREALFAERCDRDDVLGVFLLLAHSTGEPVEVLRQMKTTSIDIVPGDSAPLPLQRSYAGIEEAVQADNVEAFHFALTKKRGHVVYDRTVARPDRMAHWAALALVRLTAPHRRPDHGDLLWIYQDDGQVAAPVNWARSDIWGLRSWVERNVPVGPSSALGVHLRPPITEPIVFRRLRKHAVAREALSDPLGFRNRRKRHSDDTFFTSYAADPALRAHAGQALVDSVSALFESATQPTVIPPDIEGRISAGAVPPELEGVDVDALIEGRLDGPLAACRDPEDPPDDVPGPVCSAFANGRCYTCPNAIITGRHLPGVLRLIDLLDPDRFGRPDRWAATWKPVYDYLAEVVIPQFTDEALAAARPAVDAVYLDAALYQDLGTP